VTRIGRTSLTVPQPLSDYDDEADEQPRNGGGNHDEADETDRAKHDIAHRDLAGNGRLPDRLDDDRAGLGTG
jgi:hypothetical protein